MSKQQLPTQLTYPNAAIGPTPEILRDIHLPAKNIAIYQRSVAPLAAELAIAVAKTVACRANGTATEVRSVLNGFFRSHLPRCPLLHDDIVELISLFEATTQSPSFRLLFTTVSTDMCRKFHTDVNDLRLLCTYRGPGTLWLPDDAVVDRETQPAGDHRRKIVIDERQIQQARAGDVVILKGALYPEANPILHRSPPIAEAGKQRLLLRIDTNVFQNLWA